MAVVGLFIVLRAFAGYYTDFLWFDSAGYQEVWVTRFLASAALFGILGVLAWAVLWGNVVLAGRFSPGFVSFNPEGDGPERLGGWLQPRVRRLFGILAIAFAALNGLAATVWTQDVLFFLNREDFGIADPQFGLDVGFYVFTLPLAQDIISWLFQILVLAILLSIAVHYVNGGIRITAGEPPIVEPGARAHLSILLAGIAIVRAVGYVLDRYGLTLDQRAGEFVFGAGMTDVTIRIPALNLLALVAAATAVALIVNIWRRGWTLPIVSLGLWIVVALVVGTGVPALYQRLAVNPNEFDRESEFIVRQMQSTTEAFGLADVEARPFAGTPDLDQDDVIANRETLDNIRLWDPPVIASTFDQQQAIRPYYELGDVDVDRYEIDGDPTQVMLTSREVDVGGIQSRTWVIDHLVYTHGFGGVVSTAADVVNRLPNYLVSDVPPRTESPELETTLEGNRIYFGETYDPDSFVIAGSETPEVDFPLDGDATETHSYTGDGGVAVGNIFRRALFALRYSDFNILISPQIGDRARILVERNVQSRVAEVAPFFNQDSDPYLTIQDGRLTWIVDLYTVSDSYPYSESALSAEAISRLPRALPGTNPLPNQFNYIRNSAKATVDAYTGEVTVYVIDEEDPLASAQQRIFPNSYRSAADVPDELRDNFRYPEDLFRVQSDVWVRYHVPAEAPGQFYSGENVREIPNDPADLVAGGIVRQALRGDVTAGTRPMVPYYLLMKLPEEDELSFVILQPFNPRERPNMQAFLVAESDPEEYGRLVDYRLGRQTQVAGPSQVRANIDANDAVAQQLTLWDQQGSEVIRGNILVIPIEESFIYLQPLYLQSEAEQFPQLERVVTVYGDDVVLTNTFEQGLERIFGEGTVPGGDDDDGEAPDDGTDGDGEIPPDAEQLVAQIEAAYDAADAALAAGDLGEYQAQIEEARRLTIDLLELLAQAAG
ncbi:MAG: UPF0182 family protein [Acidimicrobiia bacterium]